MDLLKRFRRDKSRQPSTVKESATTPMGTRTTNPPEYALPPIHNKNATLDSIALEEKVNSILWKAKDNHPAYKTAGTTFAEMAGSEEILKQTQHLCDHIGYAPGKSWFTLTPYERSSLAKGLLAENNYTNILDKLANGREIYLFPEIKDLNVEKLKTQKAFADFPDANAVLLKEFSALSARESQAKQVVDALLPNYARRLNAEHFQTLKEQLSPADLALVERYAQEKGIDLTGNIVKTAAAANGAVHTATLQSNEPAATRSNGASTQNGLPQPAAGPANAVEPTISSAVQPTDSGSAVLHETGFIPTTAAPSVKALEEEVPEILQDFAREHNAFAARVGNLGETAILNPAQLKFLRIPGKLAPEKLAAVENYLAQHGSIPASFVTGGISHITEAVPNADASLHSASTVASEHVSTTPEPVVETLAHEAIPAASPASSPIEAIAASSLAAPPIPSEDLRFAGGMGTGTELPPAAPNPAVEAATPSASINGEPAASSPTHATHSEPGSFAQASNEAEEAVAEKSHWFQRKFDDAKKMFGKDASSRQAKADQHAAGKAAVRAEGEKLSSNPKFLDTWQELPAGDRQLYVKEVERRGSHTAQTVEKIIGKEATFLRKHGGKVAVGAAVVAAGGWAAYQSARDDKAALLNDRGL